MTTIKAIKAAIIALGYEEIPVKKGTKMVSLFRHPKEKIVYSAWSENDDYYVPKSVPKEYSTYSTGYVRVNVRGYKGMELRMLNRSKRITTKEGGREFNNYEKILLKTEKERLARLYEYLLKKGKVK